MTRAIATGPTFSVELSLADLIDIVGLLTSQQPRIEHAFPDLHARIGDLLERLRATRYLAVASLTPAQHVALRAQMDQVLAEMEYAR